MSQEKIQASGPGSTDGAAHPYLSQPPHSLTHEEIIAELGTNSENGLTTAEVKERLAKYGENMLEGDEGVSIAKIFIRQIANAMMLVCSSLRHDWNLLTTPRF